MTNYHPDYVPQISPMSSPMQYIEDISAAIENNISMFNNVAV